LGFPNPLIENQVKHILIILSILLLSSPVIGQSSKCDRVQIKRLIDLKWSDSEIKEVCGKYTKPSKPEKDKITKKRQEPKKNITLKKLTKPEKVITVKESSIPKIDIPRKPLNYSNKLGVRTNQGSLTTTHLNPPKNSNTRFYLLYGQIVNSEENRKLESLHTLDTFKSSAKIVGIDNRLSEDNLHYVSLLYSSQNGNVHQRDRKDLTQNSVSYYQKIYSEQNIIGETMTIEYVHHLLDDLLVGLSYKSESLKRDIKYDYQWYKSEDDSKTGLNGGTLKYESNHDYNYNSLRLQKIINNVRFDFHFTPEVISKENYSGDNGSVIGESTTGSGRTIGLNVTKLGYSNDFSLGYYKENENLDTNDPKQVSYDFGYNYFSPNIVFRGTIFYTKSEKISGLVEPYTEIEIEGKLFLFNTYEILYLYQNYKFDDIGESSDKYRITEQHINLLGFGVSFDL
jgi:hypothetical protein